MTNFHRFGGFNSGPYAKATYAVPTEPSLQPQLFFSFQDRTSHCSLNGFATHCMLQAGETCGEDSCFRHLNVMLSGPDFKTIFSKLY